MNKDDEKTILQLTSVESKKRTGNIMIMSIYCLAWLFVGVWYVMAWHTIDDSIAFASLLFGVNTAFMIYLIYAFGKLKRRLNSQYAIEVTDKAIHFFKVNPEKNDISHKCLELDQIDKAECYRYQDSGSIVFTAKSGAKLDIPVWCMPNQGNDFIEHIKREGIQIENV